MTKQQRTCDFCKGALDPMDGDLTFAHSGCWAQVQEDRAQDFLSHEAERYAD